MRTKYAYPDDSDIPGFSLALDASVKWEKPHPGICPIKLFTAVINSLLECFSFFCLVTSTLD